MILFSLLLILLLTIGVVKKKYLEIFMPCFLFLPDFYGVDFGGGFPLFTVSRMLLLLLFVYSVINRKNNLKSIVNNIFKNRLCYCLLGFFLLRIITNLYYVGVYVQALKTILELIFEQLLFLVAVLLLDPDEDEVDRIIRNVVYGASILFIIGILESFCEIRPFDVLYTTTRVVLNERFYRMGVLRSTASMGLPGYFGNMCVLIIPFIVYCYLTTMKRRYLFSMFLCMLAIIHSGSRADIFFAHFLLIIISFFSFVRRNCKNVLKIYLVPLVFVLIFCFSVSIASSKFEYYYLGTLKSVLNEVGAEYDLNEDAPAGSGGYGENVEGTYSRVRQLSGIQYVLDKSPVFGLGAGAQVRGDIKYLTRNKWKVSQTYDMGYVQVIMDEGILGGLAYTLLFIFILGGAFFLCRRQKDYYYMLFFEGIAYLLCMLSTANMNDFLLLAYMLVLRDYCKTK